MRKAERVEKDNMVLEAFIKVYCRENHLKVTTSEVKQSSISAEPDNDGGLLHPEGFAMTDELCPECHDLLAYAVRRNEKCPLDPKPRCKSCPVHCYKPEMREKIRRVMKFSGMYYLKRGRLDWVYKYFF